MSRKRQRKLASPNARRFIGKKASACRLLQAITDTVVRANAYRASRRVECSLARYAEAGVEHCVGTDIVLEVRMHALKRQPVEGAVGSQVVRGERYYPVRQQAIVLATRRREILIAE